MKRFLIILVLITSCAAPTTPRHEPSLTDTAGDGTDMGCRALASYWAAHMVEDQLGGSDSDTACELYLLLYETFRSQITDLTDNCPCIVRDMVTEKEANGEDVPDEPDILPTC